MIAIASPVAGLLSKNSVLFESVDEVLGRSITGGDPTIALEFVTNMQEEGMVRGLAMAKMFHRLKENWALFQAAGVGDSFESIVESFNGYAPSTINKYIRMWDSIFENDDLSTELKDRLSGRPITDLLLLSAAAADGSFSSDEWSKVVIAPDTQTVKSIIKKSRGERTSSKNALVIRLHLRDGTTYPIGALVATYKGATQIIGSLDVDSKEEATTKAIARLVESARIMEV